MPIEINDGISDGILEGQPTTNDEVYNLPRHWRYDTNVFNDSIIRSRIENPFVENFVNSFVNAEPSISERVSLDTSFLGCSPRDQQRWQELNTIASNRGLTADEKIEYDFLHHQSQRAMKDKHAVQVQIKRKEEFYQKVNEIKRKQNKDRGFFEKKEKPYTGYDVLVCIGCDDAKDVTDKPRETWQHVSGMVNTAYGWACPTCVKDYMDSCYTCSKRILRDLEVIYTYENQPVCETCVREKMTECKLCKRQVWNHELVANGDGRLCTRCRDIETGDTDDELDFRSFNNRNKKYVDTTLGAIIKSPRIFSVEIECLQEDNLNLRKAIRDLPPELGIISDGSLSDKGIEFNSPILAGKEGEHFVKKISKILESYDFKVDRSCGLHVHIDADKDFTLQDSICVQNLKKLWMFYIVFEDVLLSLLPPSRRKNNYCKLIKNSYHMKEIGMCQTQEDLERLWYGMANSNAINSAKVSKYHDSRYVGVNFHCLFGNNNFEIRFHSGTINATKILEWANLHLQIADAVVHNNNITYSGLEELTTITTMRDKLNLMCDLINLSDSSRKYFLKRQYKFSEQKDAQESSIDIAE